MIKKEKLLPLFIQTVKFGVVGVLNTLITQLTYALLFNGLHFDDKASNVISYIPGFVNSFFLNRSWTFKSEGSLKRDSIIFTSIQVFCFVVQYILYISLTSIWQTETYYGIPSKNIINLLANIVFTILNFVLNKLFNFKKKAN
jgi:putative flippase GtrA